MRQRKALKASGDVMRANYPAAVLNEPPKMSMLVVIKTWKLELEVGREKF
jgi:hypothetical protein